MASRNASKASGSKKQKKKEDPSIRMWLALGNLTSAMSINIIEEVCDRRTQARERHDEFVDSLVKGFPNDVEKILETHRHPSYNETPQMLGALQEEACSLRKYAQDCREAVRAGGVKCLDAIYNDGKPIIEMEMHGKIAELENLTHRLDMLRVNPHLEMQTAMEELSALRKYLEAEWAKIGVVGLVKPVKAKRAFLSASPEIEGELVTIAAAAKACSMRPGDLVDFLNGRKLPIYGVPRKYQAQLSHLLLLLPKHKKILKDEFEDAWEHAKSTSR